MSAYILRRVLQSVLVLFLVTIATFLLIHAAPGGPTSIFLAPGLSPQAQYIQAHNLGLDRPLPIQYLDWLWRMLHGDFGTTFKNGIPVGSLVWPTLLNTIILMGIAWVVTLLIAIPWGIYNSTREYGISDTVATVISYAGFALPAFWLGLMLQQIFAMRLGWLPLSDMWSRGQQGNPGDLIRHLILPVATLVIGFLAGYVKYSRSSMLEVLGQDYIRTARAKGVPESKVIFRHALRNALIPIITILGLDLPIVVAGAALTETVFNWPGMGRLFVSEATAREYNVLMAITVITAIVVVVGNLIADLLYAVVDPRVRLGKKGGEAT